jgi:uncharacterized protein (DUF305 family)
VPGYTYCHMKKYLLIGGIGVIIIAGIVYYTVTHSSSKQIGQTMTYEEAAPENPSMGDGGHGDTMVHNGVVERNFLEHMIPHHQEAVSISKQVAERSGSAETKSLAESIIAAQEKEIADMKSWYQAWYGEEYIAKVAYTPMMRDLSELSGTEMDRAFLEDMILHHTSALQQAQIVAPAATHPETIALAQTIAETQSNEIITMRMILKQLPK